MALAMDNPSYEGPQTQSKKFVGMESDDLPSTTFKDSGKLSKREKVLIILLVLILVVCIVFLVLFVQERNEDGDGPSVSGNKDNATGTQSPTTNMPTSSPPVSTAPPDFGPGPWENVRLPKHVRPVHYDVELVVDLEKLVFSGNVSVNVSVTNVSDYMFLHVNKLNISSPKLYNSVGTELTLTRHFRYKKNQFYVMEPDSRIEKGYYKIEMNFIGKLDDDLKGLYRSTYRNKDGKEITIATTQMQPTDARKAFPCFDEPAYKATFSITLVRARNLISITNMPRKHSKTRSNGMVADYYQKTVIMPTYLLAFVVCDFGYLETFAGSKNSSMKFYATKGQIDQAEFARNISGTVLEYFEQYFNISYPLPKADMIAIPDFAAGAMENWGLITYRETAILYKEGQSSESNKERITIVISHELAHMWFGNLVTPEWWDDLWLNEGFASYVEYLGVDKLFPEWLMKDMFVIQDLNYAFSLDALVTSHPILVPVNHPDEINEIFDSISYNKGASVIRMLQYFLGEDVFKSGLTNYLNAHSYGNAKTLDLWNALTEASRKAGKNIDVGKVMDTWTLQMGYPVVNVTADGRDIVLTQQRFLSDYSANQSSSKYTSQFGYTWNIPFTLEVRAANTSLEINTTKALPLIWMNRTADKTMVNGTSWDPARQWVKGNIGQTGYYRVNYPVENWKLLAQQLQHNHKVFSIGDRAGLIQDAFALADAKLLDFKYALDLTKYLDKEEDYIPWSAAYNSISSVIGILPRSRKVYRGLKEYRFKKMRPNLDRLGFVNTGGHLEKYLRVTAIFAACSVKNETCLRFTKAKFDAWIKNDTENRVSPDIRTAVYFYGMSQSGEEEWDIAFERFQKTNVASERRKLMFGLAGAPEPWLINRYLQYAFDPTKIKSQDTSYVISYVANSSPSGRHFAWNFLKEMWPVVLKRYGQGFGFSMNRFVNGVALGFSTKWELEELEKLFKKYPQTGSGTQARAQLLEKVRSNIQWRADNEKVIEDWLDALTN